MLPHAPNQAPNFYSKAELPAKQEEMKVQILASASEHMDDQWGRLLEEFHVKLQDSLSILSPSARTRSQAWLTANPPNFGLSQNAKQAVLQNMAPMSDDIPEARPKGVKYVPRKVVEARFSEIEKEFITAVDRAMAGMKVQTRERFEEWLGRMVVDARRH